MLNSRLEIHRLGALLMKLTLAAFSPHD